MDSGLGLEKSRPKAIKIILPVEVLPRKFHRFADYHLHLWYYRVRFLVASDGESSLEANARGKLQTDLGLLRPLSCRFSLRLLIPCGFLIWNSVPLIDSEHLPRMDRGEEETIPSDSDPLIERKDEADTIPQLSPPQPATVSTLEIEDDETDGSSAACCRICLEAVSDIGDELISPCMCKGTQQFVHRSCLDHWRSVKTIAIISAIAYFLDRDGSFRNSFSGGWDRILSKHPIPFYYCIGVVVFFVLLGFFGLIVHCSSFNDNQDPCLAGCRNCCYGWGILDCLPASLEACFALVVVFIVVFAILGIAYGFLAATMAVQRIWQRHYHILTKRELTKEYVVEDLHGSYTAPKLEPEHEERLKMLKLM
ncbi:hypothetical protein ACQ4PT_016809 [Festuca glaucescens]